MQFCPRKIGSTLCSAINSGAVKNRGKIVSYDMLYWLPYQAVVVLCSAALLLNLYASPVSQTTKQHNSKIWGTFCLVFWVTNGPNMSLQRVDLSDCIFEVGFGNLLSYLKSSLGFWNFSGEKSFETNKNNQLWCLFVFLQDLAGLRFELQEIDIFWCLSSLPPKCLQNFLKNLAKFLHNVF